MLLSPDFVDALTQAAQFHRRQLRKGTEIPYVAHLLAVAGIVLEHGGSETEAIAALLHDAVEDQGGQPVLDWIRRRFGDDVAAIVAGCTDAYVEPKPPWQQRKEAYRSDYRRLGEDLWKRFSGGREGTLWYYRAVVAALRSGGDTELFRELDGEVAQLEALARANSPAG